MRIVFLGTPESAVPSLVAVLEAGHRVGLVVTRPDRPVGRSRRPQAPPLKRAAEARGLDVFQPRKVRNAAFRQRLGSAAPEVLVVVAYGRILTPQVLELTDLGAVNVHFSLLPCYRGAAPVQWALANGETRTGVTTMQMSEGLDEGDVLLHRGLEIRAGEHAPELEARLALLGAELLVETLSGLAAGTLNGVPQDHRAATHAPLLSPEDGRVDLALPASRIEGRVRGFDPWPGVWVDCRGRRLRLVEARAVEGPRSAAPPGTLEQPGRGLVELVCGEGTRLRIERVQPEGRRVLRAVDALNGRQLVIGERLERLAEPG